ncbi:MAG: hypothetical protein IKL28_03875 [Lachnospiraceae bacterium]|nr:hypothetical protein [Lachnospiraceae bacterium]
MSKYEKPMVMINEELAEGVYAASGAECWAVSEAISVQDWDGESHVFQMKFRHSTDYQHTTDGFSVTVTFSNNITKARSNESGDMVGSNSISFTRFGHSNGYNQGDLVEIKVWASTGDEATTKALSINSVEVTSCSKTVNVQGGFD